VGFCEHGNEPSFSVTCGEILTSWTIINFSGIPFHGADKLVKEK
jgi:hypothetical protein